MIVANPPPLNPFRDWPFLVDTFPADILFDLAGLAPNEEPGAQTINPHQRELS